MKKMILMAIGTLLFTAPLWAQAQHPRANRSRLTDNDDGQVEVWRRGEDVRQALTATSIRQPVLHVLFAGSGWQQSSKETLVAELGRVVMPDGVQPAAMAGSNDIASPGAVNDLQIQALIDRAIGDGALAHRDGNIIYVVFLAPDVQSTLGGSRAIDDYDSYHSHFNAHDTSVRYVVVPWSSIAAEAAAKSTIRAVVNPDGN